jgi:precorrin-6B methylase 2
MNRLRFPGFLIVAFGLFLTVNLSFAQEQQPTYEPSVGQPGKDVVWVPTQQELVERMLDLAKVNPQDFVMDLGSGDGRTVIAAARRGATALGIEYNPDMVELSKRNAAKAGVSEKATFVKADLFESDFSRATVITMFLLPDINLRLRPRLLNLKPGTRIVSNSFTMEEWQSDDTTTIDNCSSWCTAYLWIVPAKAEGKWKLPNGELTLSQQFQIINGTLSIDGKNTPVTGRLVGDKISFMAGESEYAGQVSGDTISGNLKSPAGSQDWSAVREKQ